MSGKTYTNSILTTGYTLKVAANEGLPVLEICAAAGIDPASLQQWNARFHIEQYHNVLREVVRRTGNETFWLRALNHDLLKSTNNLTLPYFLNAPDVREAMRRSDYSYRMMDDVVYPGHLKSEHEFLIRLSTRLPGYLAIPEQIDWAFSQWHGTLQAFTGPALRLEEVRLVSASPTRLAAYRRFFGVDVLEGCPHNELVFPPETADLPNGNPNIEPGLDSDLEKLLAPLIDILPGEMPFRESAYIAIQQQLIHGLPTLKKVAFQLKIGTRTLQRRLNDEGVSFQQLVDDARKYLAEYYLRDSPLLLSDIGLLLGFADHPTMTKAFRKWHGISPREFRNRIRNHNPAPR